MKKQKPVDRSDPKANRSLAIRQLLDEFPTATGPEIVKLLKERYGHSAPVNAVYLVKSKLAAKAAKVAPGSAADSIEAAKRLLQVSGGLDAAIETLKAVAALMGDKR